MTAAAHAEGELLSFVLAGTASLDPEALAALRASLRRQTEVVGPAVALSAVDRLKAAPGPADPAIRRARFTGLAAVIASEPARRP